MSALLEQELKILIKENDELRKAVLLLQEKIKVLEEQLYQMSSLLANDIRG